ncbi:serine/threonine-protein kinase dst2-like isoform X1 [Arapaima gigas]
MSLADQSQQWYPTSVKVTVLQARNLRLKGKNGTNDAYAIMQVAKEKFSTVVTEKTVNPAWKEEATFDLPLFHHGNAERCTLYVQVMHRVQMGLDKMLGQVIINLVDLEEDSSRNKTAWFKLLNKAGKEDKERGEVQLEIIFLRNNMTASAFDLSTQGKRRSRMGKLKDKLRGKKKEGMSDSASAIVPSVTQILTDSEGEENDDAYPDTLSVDKKKSKLKSLFAPKSNLQRNVSQSMSTLGSLSEWETPSEGSKVPGDQAGSSEGKKFGFLIHKRTGSSDSKTSLGSLSLLGRPKSGAGEQIGVCINGSHVYADQPESRPTHAGSALDLSGSVEDVHGAGMRQGRDEEQERKRQVEEEKMRQERIRLEEQERKRKQEEERMRQERIRQEEEERDWQEKIRLEEEKRKEEEERMRKEKIRLEEQERKRKQEEERMRQERIRQEEEERLWQEKIKLEERKQEEERIREEKIRQEEEERMRKEKIRLEEQERKRKQEEERMRQERIRQEEEERLWQEKIKLEERKQEEERIREEKIRQEEKKRKEEEERMRKEKMRLEEQERKRKQEEERMRQEKMKLEEEERERKEEEDRMRQDKIRLEERKRKEEEERIRVEEDRIRQERTIQEERERREEEEKIRQEKIRQEEEDRIRQERIKLEERNRKEEQERMRQEKIRQEEEERKRKKDEERIRREKARQEEQERKMKEEQERMKQKQEEKVRQEEKRQLEKMREVDSPFFEVHSTNPFEENFTETLQEDYNMSHTKVSAVKPSSPTDQSDLLVSLSGFQCSPEKIGDLPGPSARHTDKKRQAPLPPQTGSPVPSHEELPTTPGQTQGAKCSTKAERASFHPGKRPAPQPPSCTPLLQNMHQEEKSLQTLQEHVLSVQNFPEKPNIRVKNHSSIDSLQKDANTKDYNTDGEDGALSGGPLKTESGRMEMDVSKRPLTKGKVGEPELGTGAVLNPKGSPDKTKELFPDKDLQSQGRKMKTEEELLSEGLQLCEARAMDGIDQPARLGTSDEQKPPMSKPVDETLPDDCTGVLTDVSKKKRRAPQPPLLPQGESPEETDRAITSEDSGKPLHKGTQEDKHDFEVDSVSSHNSEAQQNAGSFLSPASTKPSLLASPEPPKADINKGEQVSWPLSATSSGGRTLLHARVLPSVETQRVVAQRDDDNAAVSEPSRPHPVKPWSTSESQSVPSVLARQDAAKPLGVLAGIPAKTKETEAGGSGPYSQLTRPELIALVLKQQTQVAEKDKKIQELEDYIDNLLVRVMEEKPSILMAISAIKKT